jgi:hypothetical protein
LITVGVDALPVLLKATIIESFDAFGPDNDPHQQHDFGAIEIDGERYFWKIDYFDPSLQGGSEDPADPRACSPSCAPRNTDQHGPPP